MLTGIGVLILGAVAIRGRSAAHAPPSAAERARKLFLSALDRRAQFDEDGMLRDLRASWTADPTFLPGPVEALRMAPDYLPPGLAAAIESLAAVQVEPVLGECLRGLLADRLGVWSPIELPPHPSDAATDCVADHRLREHPRRGTARERTDLAWSLWRRYPDSPFHTAELGSNLDVSGAREELESAAVEMADPERHPFVRSIGYGFRFLSLHRLGRIEEATRLELAADADLKRSGDGVRLAYVHALYAYHAALLREAGGDSALAAHARMVMAAADREMSVLAARAGRLTATRFRLQRAARLLDNGDLAASLEAWNGLVQLADSVGAPELMGQVWVRRGRTLVKLGRRAEAERDLLAGREFARRANHLQWQYEAEHNLLHLYEATGRDAEARRAGEAFVSLTQLTGLKAVQLMAHHDLAWFHLRRRGRERARPHFEAVLAYTDSMEGYDYWAGEYFELTGDLDRAEAYYRRSDVEQDARPYTGLARLAEATGDVDRAIRYAHSYDETVESSRVPEFAPLVPGILARHGRVIEAVAELARARERAADQGQVAAWAALSVDLAQLQLRLGNTARAARIADSAQQAAARVGSAEISLRAGALAGLARARLGGAEARQGLTEVRAAVARVERTHQVQLETELRTWYGEALAALGRTTQALATLGRAADLTDSIAVSLSLDPARAGYRAAQIQVSNDALDVILEHGSDPRALAWYAAWSVRRKSRGVVEQAAKATALSLTAIERSLASGHAIIDYVVLDTGVAALVITNQGSTLRRLPLRADTLRARVGTLLSRLAPRIGSQVDTAHATFDQALAERLYADLLAPLEPVLAGRTRLTIVADGPLHLLPFDALVVSRSPELLYALDRFTISLAPSLAMVAGRDPRLPGGPGVIVSGPAGGVVEGWEGEVAAVRSAMAARGVVELRDAEATESAIRRSAPTAGLLHFATHARPNDAEPNYARLSLVPGEGDDGQFNAYEIGELHLPGSLVVLSGCETGAGRLLGGEGVLSLSRAFLRAGASGTVATLWPVGPGTAELMTTFYRSLSAGASLPVALRDAKLALRNGSQVNPFYWAGFTLVTQGR